MVREDLKHLNVPVRVGQAVDVTGQASANSLPFWDHPDLS